MTVITVATVQLLVLLPALAALAGLLLRRARAVSGLVAVGAAALAFVLSVLQFSETAGRSEVIATFGPLPVGELQIPLNLLADRTSAVIAVVVAIVGLAVQVFSIWYLRDDPRYPVFATTVSLFLAAMLLVVQSNDLVLTLVGWEVMGWCSYLLIGHISARESARRAAYKAFMVTRVADIGFVLGLVILAVGAGTTEIGTVIAHWTGGSGNATAALVTDNPVLTAALVLLLAGIAGKSGLIPFHDWLPDAMEGPTPASALIHAATMVAAGTYVVARLHPLYAVDDTARIVLGVLAGVTMVWAALLAFAQSDIKRLLAYSTLSQIAVMASALAFRLAPNEAPELALGHLFSHALFKSLLFLAVGWLSVLAGGTAFVALRGRARGRGALYWSLAVGLAALAGLPPLVGFFSKEGVLFAAEESLSGADAGLAWFVLLTLVVTVGTDRGLLHARLAAPHDRARGRPGRARGRGRPGRERGGGGPGRRRSGDGSPRDPSGHHGRRPDRLGAGRAHRRRRAAADPRQPGHPPGSGDDPRLPGRHRSRLSRGPFPGGGRPRPGPPARTGRRGAQRPWVRVRRGVRRGRPGRDRGGATRGPARPRRRRRLPEGCRVPHRYRRAGR